MSQFKKYILTLTAFMALPLLAPASASAFPLKKCVDWLVSNTSKDSKLRPNEDDYQRFIYERQHKQDINPPIAFFTPDTSDTDLLLAVEYWWYPHNIWHQTISDEYSELLGVISAQQQSLGHRVPALEEVLPLELALKIHQLEVKEKKEEERATPPSEDRVGNPGPVLPPPLAAQENEEKDSEGKPKHPWKKPYRDSGRSASPVDTPAPAPSFDSSSPTSYGSDGHTSFGG